MHKNAGDQCLDNRAATIYLTDEARAQDVKWLDFSGVVLTTIHDLTSFEVMLRNVQALVPEVYVGPVEVRRPLQLKEIFDGEIGGFSRAFRGNLPIVLLRKSDLALLKAEIRRRHLEVFQYRPDSCFKLDDNIEYFYRVGIFSCKLFNQNDRIAFLLVDESTIQEGATEKDCYWRGDTNCQIAKFLLVNALILAPGNLTAAIDQAHRDITATPHGLAVVDPARQSATIRRLFQLAKARSKNP